MQNKPLQVTRTQSKSDNRCCGVSFLRHLLFAFNSLLLLSGLGILTVGLLAFFLCHRYAPVLGGRLDYFLVSIYILIGTGAIVVLVVFVVGCCATCQKNKSCLLLYSILLLMVLLLETCAGVVAYLYEALVKSKLASKLTYAMLQAYNEQADVRMSVDHLQHNFKCCGLSSYADWKASTWYSSAANPSNGSSVPESCCRNPVPGCGASIDQSSIFAQGCLPIFEVLIQEQLIIIGGVGLGLCCLQIFGIIFSCCLAKKVKKSKAREIPYWE